MKKCLKCSHLKKEKSKFIKTYSGWGIFQDIDGKFAIKDEYEGEKTVIYSNTLKETKNFIDYFEGML